MSAKNDNDYKVSIYNEALKFHAEGKKGKLGIDPLKPLTNQRDLSLAYSPGVAAPCLEIHNDPAKAFEYTSKGNFVAVISNGTAVLGLGNLGALASKPVMEGKAVLFKRFADIDAIDLEVSTEDPEEFINSIKYLGASWGGINLEDIKAPECFIIESKLKELMDIPVFHDDQHGTAIITAAGLINAAHLTGREFKDLKVVVNGAGSAGIACIELLKNMGLPHENAILCDTSGVIYEGRTNGMNQWKAAHAVDTPHRTLAEAMVGADVFLGLSAKGALTKEMVRVMAENPIIFAMANPDPEITPEEVREVRGDAIVATGRSDYDNQVNNVMGFPYIFRGALDVQATTINDEMKIAAAKAIAMLAREEVPAEVSAAYGGKKLKYGASYIIPVPFDSRLIHVVSMAVAEAAMRTGVARKPIEDFYAYKNQLAARLNPSINMMNFFFERLRASPKTILFTEGDEEAMIRAAIEWRNLGYGKAVLVGYEEAINHTLSKLEVGSLSDIEIINAVHHPDYEKLVDYLYGKLQRKGYLYKDCENLLRRERNVFASLLVELGYNDGMVTGLTKSYLSCVDDITKAVEVKQGNLLFGLSIMIAKNRTIFIADTTINEIPDSNELAEIAIHAAEEARSMGHDPRVAFISFSNFGNPMREKAQRIRDAVTLLDKRNVDFEYDGEMQASVALNAELLKLYPFCRLSQPANILIMPALHSANIASKLLQELGGGKLIGPVLCGIKKSIQIVQMGSTESDVLNMAAMAAYRNSDFADK
ncbi:bifunctional malic enzyme oxidoreductase/phosphotransacetylase [endosymbiont of Acanthamoeba sp. UWC8]|uniref:NADP-dependent malic enzyme n=1 Tax=endosymbiont of Acanthamoeba sp. UWC8 TaxID=86106 RepID=UPI0004D0D3BB|nr:NADP-dependent malic enzyme [endosymbiont of Acanthamoeba sp. UWC8]AIF81136.1 bifunctional malic enzyme oxidoreductase/phosphotransacetylase [endosymbiont of Acanthamoeba sp. UWC8]